MSAAADETSARLSREHVGGRCAILSLALVAVSLPVFGLSYSVGGTSALVAASTSAMICYISALIALLVAAPFQGPSLAFVGMMLGMFCRTGLPLAAAMVIHWRAPGLFDAGVLIYLLGYYVFCLALETWLSLPEMSGSAAAKGTS